MNQQYPLPTLTSRSGTHPVTVAVGEDPGLEALAQWDAMVAATSQAMSISSQRGHDYAARWLSVHGVSGCGAARSCGRYAGLHRRLPAGPLMHPRSHAARRSAVSSAARSHASPADSDCRHCSSSPPRSPRAPASNWSSALLASTPQGTFGLTASRSPDRYAAALRWTDPSRPRRDTAPAFTHWPIGRRLAWPIPRRARWSGRRSGR